ncbi:tyrosine-type recombinase/integrase [Streptoalloteichus hindustanus]|uniref:Site-specific recombinase XerD n=1 Tax=Streptoalloteichus hindustanus TaxID=2017 RepID=A0A1M5QEF8_STRHI|nr:tyrosine-type recombinase/integrase [Streptoalloteichus hindustanus]SHH12584.1 Site-specific recombinase XerD [Streptoalloteichus hindustanus]
MGHVQDRWWKETTDPETGKVKRVKTKLYGKGLRYKVRYYAPDKTEKSKSFPDRAKTRAEDFLIEMESSKREGRYVDPNAGKIKFSAYVPSWYKGQSQDASTQENLRRQVESQLVPFFGDLPLKEVEKISKVREWLAWMGDKGLSLRYRQLLFDRLSSILNAAVDEKLIHSNPCRARSVKRPTPPEKQIKPWTESRMRAVRIALPERYKITVPLGAGAGLRQGEMFGLSDDDIDREARELHVVRQVRIVGNQLVFAPTKNKKTRSVPLGDGLLDELDDYMERFPPVAVTLPWEKPGGRLHTVRLILVTKEGQACRRQVFNMGVWRPAFKRAKLDYRKQQDGVHALRHLYASSQLEYGVSIKALSVSLGHHDPGYTLRVYTHLMPSSHDRSRKAADALIKPRRRDGRQTA